MALDLREWFRYIRTDFPDDYLFDLVRKDFYVYDSRGWPNGFSHSELLKLWNAEFSVPIDKSRYTYVDGDSEPALNGHHFCHVARLYKKKGGDPERLWQAMQETYAALARKKRCYVELATSPKEP